MRIRLSKPSPLALSVLTAACAVWAACAGAVAAEPAVELPAAPSAPPPGDRPFLAPAGFNQGSAPPATSAPLRTADRRRAAVRQEPSAGGAPPAVVDPPIPPPTGGGFSSAGPSHDPNGVDPQGVDPQGVDPRSGGAAAHAPPAGSAAGGCPPTWKDEWRAWWFRRYAGSVEMREKEFYPPLYTGNYYFRPWKPDWVQPKPPPPGRGPAHFDPSRPPEASPADYDFQARRRTSPPARAAVPPSAAPLR